MPRKKSTKKTKLSPAEKKDRKRLRDRARQARKREDPNVRDEENAQKRARRKREDPDVRDEDNAQKRARQARKREDPDVRDKENAQQRARQAASRDQNEKTHIILAASFTICFVRLSPCLALPGSSFFACLPCYASSSSRGALAGAKRRLVAFMYRSRYRYFLAL
ncbi:hypothetical protein THAOC_26777 [Thalassiosira oceanica]|uniref:Uncharacterized protein n=1 Tax=Thalassiosira oceanica TaxID=159749 RepID=K0RJ75_THAOC|nr:hypothetical protein THAOC_26777 [Thalassiosira oceanica]|eukprot:EJK53723.1 hypothetical protein THAOC_26777 [Thalassiosira oceanica]